MGAVLDAITIGFSGLYGSVKVGMEPGLCFADRFEFAFGFGAFNCGAAAVVKVMVEAQEGGKRNVLHVDDVDSRFPGRGCDLRHRQKSYCVVVDTDGGVFHAVTPDVDFRQIRSDGKTCRAQQHIVVAGQTPANLPGESICVIQRDFQSGFAVFRDVAEADGYFEPSGFVPVPVKVTREAAFENFEVAASGLFIFRDDIDFSPDPVGGKTCIGFPWKQLRSDAFQS